MDDKLQDIAFYTNDEFNLEVKLNNDTVWLSLKQLSSLLEKDKSVISRHIKNIFQEGELNKKAVVAKNATTAEDGKTYQVDFYNLDVIISIGYRVKSKTATKFRIWATKIIKEHIIKGYTKNETRLDQLKKTIQLINRTSKVSFEISNTKGLIDILSDYTLAFDLLDDYDHQRLQKNGTSPDIELCIDYNNAKDAIEKLRTKFGGSKLFGNEKDESFKSSIAVIDQTFDGHDLYPSIEEKAANLIYLLVKNHSFTDGNKRIAAWLFLWYLDRNHFLYKSDGSKKIANNTLVALTLMIAESKPEEKETMIKVIINLINIKNE